MNESNKMDLELAIGAIKAARSRLEVEPTRFRELEQIDGREWKFRADRELESVILEVLQEKSDYPILSEESGDLPSKGNRKWIVDPLDGSVNFFRDIPFYCISIGLWENENPLLGAVLEMPANQLFTGIVDVGAWCNGEPIGVKTQPAVETSTAVLCTGLPARFDHSKKNIQALISACKCFGKVRMLGSAALMLCYVASGRCDSYWEKQIALWDIGAGLAIVQGAGGAIRLGTIDRHFLVDVEAASCERLLVSRVNDG